MNAFTPTERSRVRRRPQRASYDEAAVFEILDAGVMAHVGYVIDGQPFVTPTAYWREGRRLYWHGAAASRMLATVAEGAPVCVTVSFLDGFIVGRSGIVHSLNYRSAMAFGRARLLEDPAAKRAAMESFIDRLYAAMLGDQSGDGARVHAAVLSGVISVAVMHPLVTNVDDDTLRAELLQTMRRVLGLPG